MDLGETTYQNNPCTFTTKINITCLIVTGGLECGFGPVWFFNFFFGGGGLVVSFKRVISGWLIFIPFGKHRSKSPNKEIHRPEKVFRITKGSLGFCHPHIKTIYRYHLLMGSGLEKDIKTVLILFHWNHWAKNSSPWLKQHTTWKNNSRGSFFLRSPDTQRHSKTHPLRSCHESKNEILVVVSWRPPSEKYCICCKAYHTTRYLLYLHLVDVWRKYMTIYHSGGWNIPKQGWRYLMRPSTQKKCILVFLLDFCLWYTWVPRRLAYLP